MSRPRTRIFRALSRSSTKSRELELAAPPAGFELVDERLTVGASYRGEVEIEARDEDASFRNVPAALQDTFNATKFDADLPLPAELTLALAYRVSDRTTLAFDINRTFWDTYDELKIEFDNGIVSENRRDWEDANIYRLGLQYRYDDKWTFRGGVYLDESPIPDGSFAPETPRGDSIGYTAGATYQYSQNLSMDVSLLILTFDDEELSYDYYEEGGVTQPFSGTYDSSANSIGFGLSYKY